MHIVGRSLPSASLVSQDILRYASILKTPSPVPLQLMLHINCLYCNCFGIAGGIICIWLKCSDSLTNGARQLSSCSKTMASLTSSSV